MRASPPIPALAPVLKPSSPAMRLFWRGGLVAALTLLTATHTLAAWQPGGNLIGTGLDFQAVASGPDRVIVIWNPTSRYGGTDRLLAQAWTADGDIAAGWPAGGVEVAYAPRQLMSSPVLAQDGAGGAFVAWTNPDWTDVRLLHLSAAGKPADGWAPHGVPLGAGSPGALASDGEGGVLAGLIVNATPQRTRDVVVLRIDGQGVPAAGWPVGGLRFGNASDVGLLVDAGHRVYVSTTEVDPTTYRPLGAFVRRLDQNGAPDPSWPQTGVVLNEDVYATQMYHAGATQLFADGGGGVLVQARLAPNCFDCAIPHQSGTRVSNDGAVSGGWVPAPTGYWFASDRTGGMVAGVITDGECFGSAFAGNLYVVGRPSVLRLSADGAPVPGWNAHGNPAMSERVRTDGLSVTDDGLGGAYVAWWDPRGGANHLYASRLDASGKLAAGWPETGTLIGPRSQMWGSVSLVSLGEGVAVAVWTEHPALKGYIAALRPGVPGPVAELAPVAGPVGFGVVDVRPNPANGLIAATVELPDGGRAVLDLVDAGGRRIDTREFAFAGPARGAVRFNVGGTLPAGIYWLRLTQGGRVASKKVAVLE